jgi:rod shape-determining protein MreB
LALALRLRPGAYDVALDLGTWRTRLATASGALAVEEATLVARRYDGTVAQLGDEAAELLGREPEGHSVVRPVSAGRIDDPQAAVALLAWAFGRAGVRRPRVLALASAAGRGTIQALDTAVRAAGASDVTVLPHAAAAASGMGLDVREPVGTLVVDIGAGRASASVLSTGEVAAHAEAPRGGIEIGARVAGWLADVHGLDLGGRATEALALRLGAARHPTDPIRMRVRGRDRTTGAFREAEVDQLGAVAALSGWVGDIVRLVQEALSQTSPELAADVADRGVLLVGGASRLRHLDEVLREHSQLPVLQPDAPETVAVRGAGRLMATPDVLAELLQVSPR